MYDPNAATGTIKIGIIETGNIKKSESHLETGDGIDNLACFLRFKRCSVREIAVGAFVGVGHEAVIRRDRSVDRCGEGQCG
jgi:hypothetical protein